MTYAPEVNAILDRHRIACEFQQAHDPERVSHHLRRWVSLCGGPEVSVIPCSNWKECVWAARAASAAWAASAARAARAASAASAARAARAASAASAAWAAWAARDARAARDATAWDASWVSCAAAGGLQISNGDHPKWNEVLCALEHGCWTYWVCEKEIKYVPVPSVYHIKGQPHREDGPALTSLDWREYFLSGIRVDEQLVMRPETQTIAQIDGERDNDIRSLRIERFGWPRYLKETGSKCRHSRKNEIEGTREALYRTPKGEQRLVVTCPTGRMFALGVRPEVETCEQAQLYLAGGKKFNVIART